MHLRHALLPLGAALLLSMTGSSGAATPATAQDALRQYVQAESSFDLEALRAVLDPHFVETSPLGQVDDHDAVLSFYAPDKKVAAPPVELTDLVVHDHGDTAILTAQLRYTVPGHAMTLALGATAQRTPQGWHLLSAQYTPVRAQQPPKAP